MNPKQGMPKPTVPAIDGSDLTPKMPPPRPGRPQRPWKPSSASPTTRPPRRPSGADLPFTMTGRCMLCVFSASHSGDRPGAVAATVASAIEAHMAAKHPGTGA